VVARRGGVGALLAALALTGTPAASQTGLLVVAHGANEEWNARVRETVAQVRWPHGPVALAFLMGPEAATAGWDSAVAHLGRGGVTAVTVVPLMVSSHGGHYRQIEFYAGLRDSWDGSGTAHDHNVSRPPPVPVRVTPALDAARELGAALAARWAALDSRDQQRPLVLIAHGPTAEAEAERWMANLAQASVPALQRAGLRAEVRIGLLRDDAPPPDRARAVAAIRDTVQRLAAASRDSVLVLPVLISSGAINRVKIPRDLEGLPVRYVPTSLAPRPELARWIERIAASALR
jgi:sirohydrochlorin cobaltochelatase